MLEKGRAKRALFSSASSLLYQVTSIACGLILPRLILEAYGSAVNGVISSITQFLSFFTILQVGIQGATRVALYKSIAKGDNYETSAIMAANKRYYRRISFFLILYVTILAVVFPLLNRESLDSYDVVFLVIIIGTSNFAQYFFGNAYKAFLTAQQANYVINITQILTLVINTAVCWIAISNGATIVFAKFFSGIVYALNPIVIYIYANTKYKLEKNVEPDYSAIKGRRDVLANSLANIIHENVDIFFITFFCSSIEVSVFSTYTIVSLGLIRLLTAFTDGMEPAFGNMWSRGEKENLNNNFGKYEFVMFFLAILLSGCMVILILPFVELYTKGINDANYIRPLFGVLLSISVLTMSLRTPYVTLVQAAGKYKETKIGSFVEAGINIALTAIFVFVIGIEGAIIGTIVANTFRTIQYSIYASKHILERSYKVVIKRFLWIVISLTLAICISFFIVKLVNVESWLGWIVKGGVCAGIHIIVLIITSLLMYKSDLKYLMNFISKIIFRKK